MKQHTVPYDRIDEQKRVHHGNVVHSFRLYEKQGSKPENGQNKKHLLPQMLFWMRMSGLEPMTPCMSSRYSNQLSYTLTTDIIIAQNLRFVNPFLQFFSDFFGLTKSTYLCYNNRDNRAAAG